MRSEGFAQLKSRVGGLKRRYLPQLSLTGTYTFAQEDQLRALRLLVHAEIEHYLEECCLILVKDLEREIASARVKHSPTMAWATTAVRLSRQAVIANNGVTDKDILAMFSPLGLTEKDFEAVDPVFLERMRDFGRQRGDVAHRSALAATYRLNRTREEKFVDELMNYLANFDKLLMRRRLGTLL